ncbi:MAG: sigma-E factor regulatory protein RseB domain-containing protein [Thermodesulfobacteriota bacterium]
MRLRIGVALVVSLVLLAASCQGIYAQMAASKATQAFLGIESYRAVTRETGILPGNEELVKDVVYQKPWKLAATVTKPEAWKGSRFAYDGVTVSMWWPSELFGIRILGAAPPGLDQVEQVMEEDALWAAKRYAFAYDGWQAVAGRSCDVWSGVPREKEPFVYPYTACMDRASLMPLSLTLFCEPKKPCYSFSFESITLGAPVPEDAFTIHYPKNAVVFEWDLGDPGEPVESLRAEMNFPVLLPRDLPSGLKVQKAVRGRSCIPMLLLDMRSGARFVTLTEMRSLGSAPMSEAGIPVKIGSADGRLTFMGVFGVIAWVKGRTALTLVGNLPAGALVTIASSVK